MYLPSTCKGKVSITILPEFFMVMSLMSDAIAGEAVTIPTSIIEIRNTVSNLTFCNLFPANFVCCNSCVKEVRCFLLLFIRPSLIHALAS